MWTVFLIRRIADAAVMAGMTVTACSERSNALALPGRHRALLGARRPRADAAALLLLWGRAFLLTMAWLGCLLYEVDRVRVVISLRR